MEIVNKVGFNLDNSDLYKTLERNTQWIISSDTKASILIGGIVAIAGIILALDYVAVIIGIITSINQNESLWSVLYLAIFAFSFVSVFIGLCYLIAVLRARVKPEEYKSRGLITDSLLYFGSIAKNSSVKKYSEKIMQCNENDLRDEIISQIYICSLICQKKYEYFNLGLLFSAIGIVTFILLLIVGANIADVSVTATA